MQVVSGVIDGISTKTVTTKRGDADVYHAIINGEDINLGFKCPYVVGESVSLNVEHKYGSLQAVLPLGKGKAPTVGGIQTAASLATTSPVPQKPSEFPVDKGTRGITIARQNSGGHAAKMVAALISQGYIVGKDDALETFINFAYEITDFATGHREVNQAAAQAAYADEE